VPAPLIYTRGGTKKVLQLRPKVCDNAFPIAIQRWMDGKGSDMTSFNEDIHAHLVGLGFTHTHYDADWEDTGDGETGPMLEGHPGFDEYEDATDRIIIDHHGKFADHEKRDLEFEKYCDEMEAIYGDGGNE
jgi:hypothetical protein